MKYTQHDLRRLNEAAEHLKQAARFLYEVGGADCVHFGDQIEVVLETDDREAGLLPLIALIETGT